MTRRCPGVSRAVRQVFYWCVCQRERKRELELLTPMKRDSAVCGWVQGTLFATCDCVCLLMNTSVSVWIHFKRAVRQWTSPVTTHYLALSHTRTFLQFPCWAPTQQPRAMPPQEPRGSGRTQASLTGNRPCSTESLLSLCANSARDWKVVYTVCACACVLLIEYIRLQP